MKAWVHLCVAASVAGLLSLASPAQAIVPVLPPPVTRFIVPYIEIAHNRAPIEIMRGCTRGCRFCHAGMVTRPVRERPVEEVLAAVEDIVRETGFEEIALLSLSSSDYTHVEQLATAIGQKLLRTLRTPAVRVVTDTKTSGTSVTQT